MSSWQLHVTPNNDNGSLFSVATALDTALAAGIGELASRMCIQLRPYQGALVGGLARLVHKVQAYILNEFFDAIKTFGSVKTLGLVRKGLEITIATYAVTYGLAAAGQAVPFRWVLLLSVIENLRQNSIRII